MKSKTIAMSDSRNSRGLLTKCQFFLERMFDRKIFARSFKKTISLLTFLTFFLASAEQYALATDTAPINKETILEKKVPSAILKITEARNSQGKLRILVFDQAQGFPDNPDVAVFSATLQADSTGPLSVTVPGLEIGKSYAFSVMHDENEDEKLNTNFLGIPKEGIGLSRAPNLWLGKPDFEDCAVSLDSDAQTIPVSIYYF